LPQKETCSPKAKEVGLAVSAGGGGGSERTWRPAGEGKGVANLNLKNSSERGEKGKKRGVTVCQLAAGVMT